MKKAYEAPVVTVLGTVDSLTEVTDLIGTSVTT